MKKKSYLVLLILFSTFLIISGCKYSGADPTLAPDNPVEYYAVLAAKDDYSDVGMTDLLVDYIDLKRVRDALLAQGWELDQLHSLKGFDQADLLAELNWLEDNADQNDVVFFYITAHGTYLRKNINWASFFPEQWSEITSSKRILIVDSCSAAEFTNPIQGDPNPHLSIAAVDSDEYGWKGLEEEGLPIIGGVFTFYFTEALSGPSVDRNGDGFVSVQEAAWVAEVKQREYMHDVVFAVPEFVEMYHEIGVEPEKDETFPDVIVDDGLGFEFDLSAGN